MVSVMVRNAPVPVIKMRLPDLIAVTVVAFTASPSTVAFITLPFVFPFCSVGALLHATTRNRAADARKLTAFTYVLQKEFCGISIKHRATAVLSLPAHFTQCAQATHTHLQQFVSKGFLGQRLSE